MTFRPDYTLEALESRRLLAAAALTADGYFAKVNFQHATSATPAGYLADTGALLGARGNGFTYGWNADNTANARDRNALNSPDQRYDTFTHTQRSGITKWALAVPNGTYIVRLVAGDPSHWDSVYRFNVEGSLALSGTPTSATRWIEATKTVTVADGYVSVTNGAGAVNNKLAFIEIKPAASTPTSVSIAATDSTAAEANRSTGKFTVTRTGSTAAALTVNYTRSGSASNGVDYDSLSGKVTIPAGAASATITVTPKVDGLVEGSEKVTLTLAGTTKSATVTIADDDPFASQRTAWWRDARYGMFIHWGLYSVPAGVWNGTTTPGRYGEWIMSDMKIPIPEYEKFADQFNPTQFNAAQWVQLAKDAGMKYIVITSKHHDGFSMFDTAVNGYDVKDGTPFKRDVLAELKAACKAAGIRFGVYYSIMDWHDPDAAGTSSIALDRYVGRMKTQLREIVTKYDPDLLWFDGEWKTWWTTQRGDDLEAYVRGLKPSVIVNNRVGKRTTLDGDYETPEQTIPAASLGKRLWETCMTLNGTWGYRSDDHNWKSAADVLRKLATIAGRGGNFLLNVGPKADGTIPTESVNILKQVGQWLATNGSAIYRTTYPPSANPAWGSITRGTGASANRYHAIIFDWPSGGGTVRLPLRGTLSRAWLLKTGASISFTNQGTAGIDIHLPGTRPDSIASVVELEFTGTVSSV